MGEELGKFTVTVGKEFGVIAVLLILSWVVGVIALGWFLWQTSKNNSRSTTLMDKLFTCMDDHRLTLGIHDRQGQGIAKDVSDIKDIVTRIEGKVC